MKLELLSNLFKHINSSTDSFGLNNKFISDYLSFYLLDNSTLKNLNNNQSLFTSQYRPMKKGITNMIRLHSTGAIAMPIEIRMHILASSRDVIHS